MDIRRFWLPLLILAACTQPGTGELPAVDLGETALEASIFSTTLVAQHSDKCADVPRSSRRTGVDLIQWSCHDGANQRFGFHPVDKNYAVRSEASGLCLEVSRTPRDGLYVVTQEVCDEASNQQFSLKPGGTPEAFSLVAGHNGSCIDVAKASTTNRAKLIGYRCHGGANQAWVLPGYRDAPTPEAPVKVVAVGDIACDPTADSAFNGGVGTAERCRMKATALRAESLRPDAVLALGDLQYNTGLYEEFLQSYGPTWGRFKGKTYPVPGNHEYDSGAAGYYKYFGSRAGDPAKGYYSFDLGDWHVIALNTNSACKAVSCAAGSAQERWLRADLAANRNRCVLATMHHPRYSSGRHGGYGAVDGLWDALAEGGVDAVLAGHDHHYERFAPQSASGARVSRGLRQFVVGTGGKSLYATKSPHPNSQKIVAGKYGVLELELAKDSYSWAFVTESGARLDAGSAVCN